jgi:outer membrane biosynthesis protein TonB
MSTIKNKNLKAASYTILVLVALCMIFFFVSWTPPARETPKETENIEVEWGDAPEGTGNESEGAAANNPMPPSTENIASSPTEKSIETNDADKEAPAMVARPKVEVKKVVPVVETPPPTPKYLYKGQSLHAGQAGTRDEGQGNSQEQGLAAGQAGTGGNGKGTGDEGQGIGSGGLSIVRGLQGRKISRYPSFVDEFNENAKVAVDVRVDQNGNVVGVNIQPRGTTTGNSAIKNIALQKAKLLKFTANADGADEEVGTVVFVFRVRD